MFDGGTGDGRVAGDGVDAGPGPDASAADGAAAPRLTRAPTVHTPPRPVYPPAARAAGISADVQLEVDIDSEGNVRAARVLLPVGQGFDEAAQQAVEQMRFVPAEIDGRPAALRFHYTLRFRPVPVGDGGLSGDGGRDAGHDGAGDAPAPPPAARPAQVTPPAIVRGTIRERGTREPVAGAQVVVTSTDAAGAPRARGDALAETDAEGNFQLSLAAGQAPVRITVIDLRHQPCVRDVPRGELVAGRTLDWTCFTDARSGPSYETVVSAEHLRREQARHQLRREEARSVPGTMGDPIRAVQSLPGVARPPYGLGLLVVRGASPADSGAFLDGLEIPALYHFLVGPSVLTAELIDSIDFYPGGFAVKYGRMSAGAIDVGTRKTRPARVRGAAEVSPLDASLFVEGPVAARTALTLAVRRSTIDLILPSLVPEKPGSTFTTAVPAYWDYQARLTHRLAGGGRLSLFLFGSDDQLDIVSADPNRRLELDNHIGFHRVSLRYTETLGPWTSELQPAYGQGDQSFSAGSDSGFIRYRRLYLRHDLSRDFGPRLGLALGLDGLLSYDWGQFDFQFPREGRTFGASKAERVFIERSYVDVAPALWTEMRINVGERLKVSPGLRFDSYFVVGTTRHTVDPRLGLHFQAAPDVGLRAGAGLYHQLPNPRYLDPEYGNNDLAMVAAQQYHLGADYQLSDSVRLSGTIFAVWRRNIPVTSPQRFSSLGRARARGLELLARHHLSQHFYGWLAYTLSRAEQSADFADEAEMGLASTRGVGLGDLARRRWRPSTFDQTHNLVAVGSYRRGAWELGARYRLVSGRPTTAITGSFADLDFAAHTPERGAAYSDRHPTFSQLDLRAERTFTFDRYRLGAFLDVQNALNAENPEDLLHDYRYRESAPVRGLPILPLLGLRGAF
jgi:TonB family protein